MLAHLNVQHAQIHRTELQTAAARWRRGGGRRHHAAPAPFWGGVTLRLATSADRASIARLAELDERTPPAEPVLLALVTARAVAALSLRDGRVIADPFAPTAELIELMRLRAAQLLAR